MGYKSREQQREYQRRWMARRRSEYLSDKSCAVCGSRESLEVDHINPETKITHAVWSWSKPRRDRELAKCQVLCHRHHLEKTQEWYSSRRTHGTVTMYRWGCRCEPCRTTYNRTKREQRHRREKRIR